MLATQRERAIGSIPGLGGTRHYFDEIAKAVVFLAGDDSSYHMPAFVLDPDGNNVEVVFREGLLRLL